MFTIALDLRIETRAYTIIFYIVREVFLNLQEHIHEVVRTKVLSHKFFF